MEDWWKYGTVRLRDVNSFLCPLEGYGLMAYCHDRVQNMLDLDEPPEV